MDVFANEMGASCQKETLKEQTGVPFPLNPSLAPLLLFDQPKASGDHTMFLYSIPKKQLLVRGGDSFRGYRYWFTPQGWVLMLHLELNTTFLWNPSNLQRISLPADQENLLQAVKSGRCLLSLKPTDSDCVVLVVDERAKKVIYYCHTGGSKWFKHEHEQKSFRVECLATLGGKFCAYDCTVEKFVTLEFLPHPVFLTRGMLKAPCPGYRLSDVRILECGGELFVLRFCHRGLNSQQIAQIFVYKMDFSEGAWSKVNTIGDMVFFFDNCRGWGSSFHPRQLGLTKGDCIYYLTSEDKLLYVHDMKQGSISMLDSAPSVPDSSVPQFLMPSI